MDTTQRTCPNCSGTEFTQDTDDFDRGEWGLFRCETCFAELREESTSACTCDNPACESRFATVLTGRMVRA